MYDGHLHGPFHIETLKFAFFKWKNICARVFKNIQLAPIEIKLKFMQISVAGGSGFQRRHPQNRRKWKNLNLTRLISINIFVCSKTTAFNWSIMRWHSQQRVLFIALIIRLAAFNELRQSAGFGVAKQTKHNLAFTHHHSHSIRQIH